MKASQALDVIGDTLLADLTVPHKRAGLIATMATAAVLAQLRMRFVPAVALSVAAGFAAERLYVVIDDVHRAALTLIGPELTIPAAPPSRGVRPPDAEHRAD